MFKTKEILKATAAKIIGKAKEGSFEGISQNSKTIQRGEIFVAICGQRFDGHRFLEEAFEHGAAAAIVERGKVKKKEILGKTLFEVPDTVTALGDLARYHRKKYSIPVIGITGSNGKTTTKDLLATILGTKFKILKTSGNQNNLIGLPFTLFRLDPTVEIAVLELGMSLPFEIRRLSEIAMPSSGLITNIGDTHLETMLSRDKIAESKAALFEALPSRGMAFVNRDDPYLSPYAKKLHSKVLTYSLGDPAADMVGEILEEHGLAGSRMRVSLKSPMKLSKRQPPFESLSFFLPLPGRHNAMNALAAVAVASTYSMAPKKITEAIESFRAVSGRSRVIALSRGITIIDDCYNANPSSVREALTLLKSSSQASSGLSNPETYAVLGDMLELGPNSSGFHEQIGHWAARCGIDNLLTLGPLSQYIVKGAERDNKELRAFWTLDQNELINHLKHRLSSRKGDAIILVKGSRGMKMDRVVEDLMAVFGSHRRSDEGT